MLVLLAIFTHDFEIIKNRKISANRLLRFIIAKVSLNKSSSKVLNLTSRLFVYFHVCFCQKSTSAYRCCPVNKTVLLRTPEPKEQLKTVFSSAITCKTALLLVLLNCSDGPADCEYYCVLDT